MTEHDHSKDQYERKFLEILLRHELPDDCTVHISVTPKEDSSHAKAEFKLQAGQLHVNSNVHELRLPRTVGVVDNW